MKDELYAAMDALDEFGLMNRNWQYVNSETKRLLAQMKNIVKDLESLLQDMEIEENRTESV